MGLLFNAQHRKRVPDHEIDIKDIREIAKKLSLHAYGARTEFESLLNKAQTDGITRDEVINLLQKMILDGKLTEDKAENIAGILGVDGYLIKKIKDISESREANVFHSSASSGSSRSAEPEEKSNDAGHASVSFNNSKTSRVGPIAGKKEFGGNINTSSSRPPSKIWSALRKINK